MSSNPVNPYAAPQSTVQDVPTAARSLALASRGRRLGATLLDGFFFLLIVGCLGVGAEMNSSARRGDLSSVVLIIGLLALGGLVLTNAVLLAIRGQTLGKRALKIQVVRPDGSHVAALRILGLRWFVPSLIGAIPLVGPVFQLADALVIFRDSRRCLHDEIADTIVIDASNPAA